MGHRQLLLDAARRLIEEQGYAHITTRDLVAESGTNLASIGYHFGSKAGLLNQAIEDAFADWAAQLADLVMADPSATPIQRACTTWAAVRDALPRRQPMLQAYVEALAQAQREPNLRAQLAGHMRRVRTMVAERAAESLAADAPHAEPIAAEDPRCQAIASFVIAVCDGLALQWLLDPDHMPGGEQLISGLALAFAASFPVAAPGLSGSNPR